MNAQRAVGETQLDEMRKARLPATREPMPDWWKKRVKDKIERGEVKDPDGATMDQGDVARAAGISPSNLTRMLALSTDAKPGYASSEHAPTVADITGVSLSGDAEDVKHAIEMLRYLHEHDREAFAELVTIMQRWVGLLRNRRSR